MRYTGKRPRIFIGIFELGSFTFTLSKAMRELGLPVTAVVMYDTAVEQSSRQGTLEIFKNIDGQSTEQAADSRHIVPRERQRYRDHYLRIPKNRYLRRLFNLKEFAKVLLKHDVFIYSSTSFCPFNNSHYRFLHPFSHLDWAILKLFRKTLAVVILGSELRSYRQLASKLERDGLDYYRRCAPPERAQLEDLDAKRHRARLIDKYADQIFAQSDTAELLSRNYHFPFMPLDVRNIECHIDHNPHTPLIVHAPSERGIKGTKYVIEAVERLKHEGYLFRFELCENVPNDQLRTLLSAADIAVDQLLLPSYGLFALEAMASGCAVLTSAIPGYNGVAGDIPILSSNPETIYDNLKCILDNPLLRITLAQQANQ